jgi:uncharacterized protein YraI
MAFWSRFGQRDGRGLYRSVTFLTLFSLLFGGLLLMQPVGAGAQSSATTTDSLNLRTGPGTNTSIVTVMPYGATVSVNGAAEAGFYPVSYNGYSGYASGDYLSIGGGGSSGVATDGATGTANVVDGRLNLRSGASLSHGVILVMPDGAAVSLTGEYANGFLGIVYNGTSGFAHGDYLSTSGSAPAPAPSTPPVSGNVTGTATVNVDALNIRSGPSTSNGVLGVMQYGASVSLTGDSSSGFVGVIYNGIQGWTFAEYLSTGGTSAPAPAPSPGSGSVAVGDTVVSTGYVSTDALNFRSGPGTSYGVITVMYNGAGVEIMGDPQAGFYPIRYNGSKGWASTDYITKGSPAPSTPAPTTPAPGSGSTDIVSIIYAAADRYGQPRADMLRVAKCESVLDPNAINPRSNASGLFQFLPGTWATTPYADQDIFDPVANANAAGWMWSVGRRSEWTCQ